MTEKQPSFFDDSDLRPENAGEPWTVEQSQQLMALWLQDIGTMSIAMKLARPWRTITNHIWKMVNNYRDEFPKDFDLGFDRTGTRWTKRDHQLMQMAPEDIDKETFYRAQQLLGRRDINEHYSF